MTGYKPYARGNPMLAVRNRDESGAKSLSRRANQELLLELVRAGNPPGKACEMLGYTKSVLWKITTAFPDFDQELAAAIRQCAHSLVAGLALDETDIDDPKKARIANSNRVWLAGMLNRDAYGQRSQVDHNHTVDIGEALRMAHQRASSVLDTPAVTLDHEPIETIQPDQVLNALRPTDKRSVGQHAGGGDGPDQPPDPGSSAAVAAPPPDPWDDPLLG